jgi:hypothetical protein
MSKVVWKRVKRGPALGAAVGMTLGVIFIGFVLNAAWKDLELRAGNHSSAIFMKVLVGLPLGLFGLMLLVGVVQCLYEGITGRRPCYRSWWPLMGNANAHLANGETEYKV